MKKFYKIITPAILIIAAAVAVFFLAPLKAWKNKTMITVKGLIENGIAFYSPKTVTPENTSYVQYCLVWWQCYFGTQATYTSPDHTYDGGELEEITVKPNNEAQ